MPYVLQTIGFQILKIELRQCWDLGTSALKELEITANTQFDDDFENFKHWSKIKLAFSKRLITKNSFNKYALNSTKSTKTDIEKNIS